MSRAPTPAAVDVRPADPDGPPARRMRQALWAEIQARYRFCSADPFDPGLVEVAGGGFWIAVADGDAVGSIALLPFEDATAELDVMYVSPRHRRTGIADALLRTLEDHARSTATTEILLRAGAPQPEAIAFYHAAGFEPVERFGRWTRDDTAMCFRKALTDVAHSSRPTHRETACLYRRP